MEEKREVIRKTVSLDKGLVTTCEALYGAAGAENFTQFTANALEMYANVLSGKKQGPILAKEIRKALREEVQPVATRLSKGLYRYAILLDIMCQILACMNFSGDPSILDEFLKTANVRVAKMRGSLDIKSIVDDAWNYYIRNNEEIW